MQQPEFNAAEADMFVAARIAATLAAVEMTTPHMNVSDHNMRPEDIAVHARADRQEERQPRLPLARGGARLMGRHVKPEPTYGPAGVRDARLTMYDEVTLHLISFCLHPADRQLGSRTKFCQVCGTHWGTRSPSAPAGSAARTTTPPRPSSWASPTPPSTCAPAAGQTSRSAAPDAVVRPPRPPSTSGP